MNRRLSPATRRLVLAAALAAGLAVWLFPHPTDVLAASADVVRVAQAAEPKAAKPAGAPAADAPKADAKGAASAPAPKSVAPPPPPDADPADADAAAAAADASKDAKSSAEITIDRHGIVVEKGKKRVRVQGLGADREYDSFESFVQDSPWLAVLVFMTVLLVFLVPLLIIVLLIWYKVRKNRMLNETMLKLAERGVAPADAMAALDVNAPPPRTPAAGSMPLYEQAKQIRQRTVASDLRKGVMLIAAGLALSLFSMLDDASANSVGLVLLFVGIGYCVLWYFEGRNPTPRAGGVPPAGGA